MAKGDIIAKVIDAGDSVDLEVSGSIDDVASGIIYLLVRTAERIESNKGNGFAGQKFMDFIHTEATKLLNKDY